MRGIVFALACTLGACSTPRLVAPLRYSPPAPAPDEPFRALAPPTPPVVEAREAVRETTLPNGLHVVLAERHGFPVVAAELLIDRGALDLDDPERHAISEMTYLFGRFGDESTLEQISAEAAASGVSWSAANTDDSSTVTVRAPSDAFDSSLRLLARGTIGAKLGREEYDRRAAELRQAARGERGRSSWA